MRVAIPMVLLLTSLLMVGCPDSSLTTINAPPVGEITYPSDGLEITAGPLTAIGVVEDPDGSVEILEVSWLVDGDEACPSVPPSSDGISSCDIFLEAGSRTLTLQVRDPQGKSGSDAVSLEVAPYGDPWAEARLLLEAFTTAISS